MDEMEIDISYERLMEILQQTCGELQGLDPSQGYVIKVVDKPSIFPGNDRVTIHIEMP